MTSFRHRQSSVEVSWLSLAPSLYQTMFESAGASFVALMMCAWNAYIKLFCLFTTGFQPLCIRSNTALKRPLLVFSFMVTTEPFGLVMSTRSCWSLKCGLTKRSHKIWKQHHFFTWLACRVDTPYIIRRYWTILRPKISLQILTRFREGKTERAENCYFSTYTAGFFAWGCQCWSPLLRDSGKRAKGWCRRRERKTKLCWK